MNEHEIDAILGEADDTVEETIDSILGAGHSDGSYPPDMTNDAQIADNILYRKEFYALKYRPDDTFRTDRYEDTLRNMYLKIQGNQLFTGNFMNPDTAYKRMLLQLGTGIGKTMTSVIIAHKFIQAYRKIFALAATKIQANRRNYGLLDKLTPTVYVLGFGGTKAAFVRELLNNPEFGFVSISEKDEIMKRRKTAESGLPDDIKHLRDYLSYLRRRVSNKMNDGFYKFYGYDEFVNRLFYGDIKLTDIDAQVNARIKAGESITLEEVIYDHIAKGTLQADKTLIDSFENSLLICDEVHNTYNMNMKNNRGVAIQFIIDSVPSLRVLLLTATPISNSPTEVIEIVNYLCTKKITRNEFFSDERTLRPGKLEELGVLLSGRISFLQDTDMRYYPKREFMGETVTLPREVDGLSEIPYITFFKCPMSEFHQRTYTQYLQNAKNREEHYHAITIDGYSIFDIAFPNPDSEEVGLFRSTDTYSRINAASQEWRDEHKIVMKRTANGQNILSGQWLEYENIGHYSTKSKRLLELLCVGDDSIMAQSENNPAKTKKVLIHHPHVRMSGVLFIQELLVYNGFIDAHTEPSDSSICLVCRTKMAEHTSTAHGATSTAHSATGTAHDFIPARFAVLYSELEKAVMDQILITYNAPDNVNGHKIAILVGSRIIEESYDFKDVQALIPTSLPVNIPTTIQLGGRIARRNSHINLPPNQRYARIYTLLTVVNPAYPHEDPIFAEEYRYIDKMNSYLVIQQIESKMHEVAIDADIHRGTIMSQAMRDIYWAPGATAPAKMVGNLYYEPAHTLQDKKLEELNTNTFIAYRHFDAEIDTITMLIKRLFILAPVWSYDNLWEAVRDPPYGIETNPALFDENNFIIALYYLTHDVPTIINASKARQEITERFLVDRLFDKNERYLWLGNQRHKIVQVAEYYIRFPIGDKAINPINSVRSEYSEHLRDHTRIMIRDFTEPAILPIIDADSFLRPIDHVANLEIDIGAYLQRSNKNTDYLAFRDTFVDRMRASDCPDKFLWEFPSSFQIAFAQEAIVAALVGRKTMAEYVDRDSSYFAELYKLYDVIIEFLDKFGAIIRMDEVRRYKDIAKSFEQGLSSTIKNDKPIGLMVEKAVRLFDTRGKDPTKLGPNELDKWVVVSKLALNRHMTYKENEIIIGYMETDVDHMKFKLRKPVHKISLEVRNKTAKFTSDHRSSHAIDTRTITRGMVCSTIGKEKLLILIGRLGINISKMPDAKVRVNNLCAMIRNRLITSEIKERAKSASSYKYFYSWWDEMPQLAA